MTFKHVYEENKRREKNYAAIMQQNAQNPCCYNCRWYRKVSTTQGMCVKERNSKGIVYKAEPNKVCEQFLPNTSDSPILW